MVDSEKTNPNNNKKHLISIYKFVCKYKPIINSGTIFGVLYIILLIYLELLPSRICCLYEFLFMRTGISFFCFNRVLLMLRTVSWIVIVLCLFLSMVIRIIQKLWDCHLRKIKGNNRFDQSALRYMREKGSPHCFLVSGDWGSGKTYEVNDFINKYYYCSSVNIYRVSCFGLSTRSEVIEEINRTIERSDSSLYKTTSELIEYIPVFGKLVSKLISRVYSYDKAKKGSIFVFDDFERITSRTTGEVQQSDLYKRNALLQHHLSNTGIGKLDNLDEEFRSIERSFNYLREKEIYTVDRADSDKYISIAGLINELIETHKMKVFIICNTDVVGEKFIHDVLRSKLNCIEFRKVTTNENRESVINQLINNTVFEDSQKQTITVSFIRLVSRRLNDVVIERTFGNLRLFSGLFEALINEVALIDNKYLTMDFLESLFQSIILTHLLYYNNDLSMLESFENGMNIAFQLKLYDHKREYTWLTKEDFDYKWVDLALSAHWICNLTKPVNINSILKHWNEYEYSELEKNLNKDYLCIEDTDRYTLLHVLFIQQVYGNDAKWDYKKAINNVLKEYDLTRIDVIQDILDLVNTLRGSSINMDFYKELFNTLRKGNAEGEIVGVGYIYELYRSTDESNKRGGKELSKGE